MKQITVEEIGKYMFPGDDCISDARDLIAELIKDKVQEIYEAKVEEYKKNDNYTSEGDYYFVIDSIQEALITMLQENKGDK